MCFKCDGEHREQHVRTHSCTTRRSSDLLGQPSETMPTVGGMGSCFSMSLARQIGVPATLGERGAVLQRDPGTISMMTSPACRDFASASQKPKQSLPR